MHVRSTLAAFVLAALLGGHYFAFERPLPVEDEVEREPLTTISVEEITRIEIARAGATAPVVLVREAGTSRWRLGDDPSASVDQQLIYAVYRALHEHPVITTWEGSTAEHGLAAPVMVVALSDGTRAEWIRFGGEFPGGQRRYLLKGAGSPPTAVAERASIGLVVRAAADAFDHSADAWRDRRLVTRPDAERAVRRIDVRRGELAYAVVLEGDRWRLDPGGERVRREVDGQVATLLAASHEGTRPTVPGPAYATISIGWADGSAPQVLEVAVLDDERGYWVSDPTAPALQRLVARTHLEWLLGGPDELRALERVAGKAGAQYLVRIEVESPGEPPVTVVQDDARKLVLEQPGAAVGFTSKAAKRVALFLEGAKIKGRISSAPTAEELGALGLAVPVARYTVLRRWAERGRDREATTVVAVGVEGEGGVAVRIDDGTAVYLIDAAIGRLLRGGALALRTGQVLAGLDLLQTKALRFADLRDPAAVKTFALTRKADRWLAGAEAIAPQSVAEIFARIDAMEVDHFWPRNSPPGAPAQVTLELDVANDTVTLALELLPGDLVRIAYTRDGATLRGVATHAHAQAIAALVGALAAGAKPAR